MIFIFRFLAAIIVLLFVNSNFSYGSFLDSKDNEKLSLDIKANEIEYDLENFTIIAKGNVFVVSGEKNLNSDYIKYNKKLGTLEVEGDIYFHTKDKGLMRMSRMESSDDFYEATLYDFSFRFKDGSIMKGTKALRKEKNLFIVDNVDYTPCPVCRKVKNPMLGIYARRALLDEAYREVLYRDVFINIYGVPVLYLPFFFHDIEGVSRRSGFLTPSYSESDFLGYLVKVPYYLNLKPNLDAIVSPSYSTKEGLALNVELRHLLSIGSYNLDGSIRRSEKNDLLEENSEKEVTRWHIKGEGHFFIDEKWNLGFSLKRASDDIYMEKYNKDFDSVLTSEFYISRLDDRNYFNIKAISFQELESSYEDEYTPYVLPYMNFHYETDPDKQGMNFVLDGGFLSINRELGVNYDRASLLGSFQMPYVSDIGMLFEVNASLRLDDYLIKERSLFVDKYYGIERKLEERSAESRIVPKLEFKVSYPLVSNLGSDFGNSTVFVEPIIVSVFSYYDKNQSAIPNEDSQSFEFASFNLFDPDYYFGIDKVEEGVRFKYGVHAFFDSIEFGNLDLVIGQSYMLEKNNNFAQKSGLENNASDYVGKISYMGLDRFNNLSYSFHINGEGQFLQYYLKSKFILEYIDIDFDYFVDKTYFDKNIEDFRNNKLFLLGTKFKFDNKLRLSTSLHYDLENDDWIRYKISAEYEINCASFSLSFSKTFIEDRELQPDTSFSFSISIKNFNY